MNRLVIDVSREQHQQIKALVTLQGKTMKEFILEKVFSSSDKSVENDTWAELEDLLASRIKEPETIGISAKSFDHLTEDSIKVEQE